MTDVACRERSFCCSWGGMVMVVETWLLSGSILLFLSLGFAWSIAGLMSVLVVSSWVSLWWCSKAD